ncbi:pyridoxamine 5'-phosphate oxidase, partial [Arachnia propionica]
EPWKFFTDWLDAAIAADEVEPNAMLLATIGADGRPRSRVVLLKETSQNGLVFFTHYTSPKGEELAANPVASATFWWPGLMRQVRAVGAVTKLTRQENETYFAKRPRASQLGAWASRQSTPIVSHDDLLEAAAQASERFEGKDVPCPPEWGGYRIDVDEFEFWQGQSGRLHDRVLARRNVDGWSAIHIQP